MTPVFKAVIPARYGSTRLPAKALRLIAGKPMVRWVYERARASQAQEVIVATDDERIANVIRDCGGKAVMTPESCASGTDRVAAVAVALEWSDETIVVNVQGDEPMMPPALIDQVAGELAAHPEAHIATVAAPVSSMEEFLNPNFVKVAVTASGRTLYFSRAPIPWNRDGAVAGAVDGMATLATQTTFAGALRHIGLYAYRSGALRQLAALPPSPLEQCEQLEQLRALEAGLVIQLAKACATPGMEVNTAEDLERVAARLTTPRPAATP